MSSRACGSASTESAAARARSYSVAVTMSTLACAASKASQTLPWRFLPGNTTGSGAPPSTRPWTSVPNFIAGVGSSGEVSS